MNNTQQNNDNCFSEFEELHNGFTTLPDRFDELLDHISKVFLNWTSQVKYFHEIVNSIKDSDNKSVLQESLSGVIIDLQFHDIISQKLDHIRITNGLLAEELKQLNFQEISIDESKFVHALPGLLNLNIALIDFVVKEHRSSTKELKDNLINILNKHKINGLTINHTSLYRHNENFLDVARDIRSNYAKLIIPAQAVMINHMNVDKKESTLNEVRSGFTMRSEREVYNSVFKITEQQDDIVEIDLF